MNIEVGKAIKELLYEHPAVIIPGLGGFTSAPNPATVDYVQSMVTPPVKKLEFNPNLVINDGMLVGYIQKTEAVTAQQAKEAVDLFVEDVRSALERREIVEVTDIGRLYKDYEHKIRFMPEGTNFDVNSYGLPNVQFNPVVRERPASTATATPGSSIVPPVTRPAPAAATVAGGATSPPPQQGTPVSGLKRFEWANKLWPALVMLSAVLVALSIFFFFRGDGKSPTASDGVHTERLNVSPKTTEENTDVGTPEERPQVQAPAPGATTGGANTPNAAAVPKQGEVRIPPPIRGLTSSFIVIHSLGNEKNVERFKRQLIRDGYEPHLKQAGSLYRIGILFEHRNQAELDEEIQELARKYDASPKVLEE